MKGLLRDLRSTRIGINVGLRRADVIDIDYVITSKVVLIRSKVLSSRSSAY